MTVIDEKLRGRYARIANQLGELFADVPDPLSRMTTAAVAETALGRIADPTQIADAVLYLLSEQASHVTGTTLVVDGGQTA